MSSNEQYKVLYRILFIVGIPSWNLCLNLPCALLKSVMKNKKSMVLCVNVMFLQRCTQYNQCNRNTTYNASNHGTNTTCVILSSNSINVFNSRLKTNLNLFVSFRKMPIPSRFIVTDLHCICMYLKSPGKKLSLKRMLT